MRFSASTIALFAGLAAALPNGEVHTVYQTEDVTITSCAASVTDCPGRQTSTPEGVEPVTTPVAVTSATETPVAQTTPASETPVETSPAEETSPAGTSPVVPAIPTSSAGVPPQVPSGSGSVPPAPSSSSPVIPQPPQVSSQSVTVIAVTTCIPTVTYSTITGPAPTGVSPGHTSSVPVIPGSSAYPSGSATPSSSGPGALFTGAANTVGNSFGLAGAAAAAAFFLA
ncbi:hypothetical protein BDV29DRAFT_152661 [Aspergillus leporis]|uniref:GPI anchored serine-rich protein n=1 Tax=Aspergillus leporis TaxID=41062 RepID=A0A5N5XCN9_9EURO|nr:hypothetical protein BDV29DRAFT_152661 [Aspergillus leporis]